MKEALHEAGEHVDKHIKCVSRVENHHPDVNKCQQMRTVVGSIYICRIEPLDYLFSKNYPKQNYEWHQTQVYENLKAEPFDVFRCRGGNDYAAVGI